MNHIGTKTYEFANGTEVELTAVPYSGSKWNWWEGDYDEEDNLNCLVTVNGNKTITARFNFFGGPNVAASSNLAPFTGYGMRVASVNFLWDDGDELLDKLAEITNVYGSVKNLYIFGHAWVYNLSVGSLHEGGQIGSQDLGPSNTGFYGAKDSGDGSGAADLNDLSTHIGNDSIVFAPVWPVPVVDNGYRNKLFLEGCHVFEIGNFVSVIKGIANRDVTAPCGSSSEDDIGSSFIDFISGPESAAESTDTDYDGWRRRNAYDNSVANLGGGITVPL